MAYQGLGGMPEVNTVKIQVVIHHNDAPFFSFRLQERPFRFYYSPSWLPNSN